MKRSSILITCLVCLSLIFACATIIKRPDYCIGKSYIYDVAEKYRIDPQTINSSLLLIDTIVLKAHPDQATMANTVVTALIDVFDDNITYSVLIIKFKDYTGWLNNYYGEGLVLVSTIIPYLNYNVPITNCDRLLVLYHLQEVQTAIQQYMPASEKAKIQPKKFKL